MSGPLQSRPTPSFAAGQPASTTLYGRSGANQFITILSVLNVILVFTTPLSIKNPAVELLFFIKAGEFPSLPLYEVFLQ